MDTRLFYIDEGPEDSMGLGEALVLLHGNGECSQNLRAQIDVFKREYRVIAPDTRGHGLSPRGIAPFTLQQFAEDLARLLDELGVRQAHVLGFSDGANIAMLFAMQHPDRILSLVLAGGNLFPEGLRDDVRVQDRADLDQALQKGDIRQIELLRLMTDEPSIDPHVLGCIVAPTLVVAGTQDMIKEEHTRLIAASIPDSSLRFIEGTHFVVYEDPSAFNRVVGEFLSQHTGTQDTASA